MKFAVFGLLVLILVTLRTPVFSAENESAEVRAEMARLEERIDALESLVLELTTELRASRVAGSSTPVLAPGGTASSAPSAAAGPVTSPVIQVAGAPGTTNSNPSLTASWKEGFRLDSEDKQFSFKFGGRIMNDWSWGTADQSLEDEIGSVFDGTEFRRARILSEGVLWGRFQYKAEYDFAPLEPDFKDVYVGFTEIPVIGTLRVGHFKEPFSLSELTSSKYITFMERPVGIEAFAPSRNNGAAVTNDAFDHKIAWTAGVFRSTVGNGLGFGDRNYNFSGRLSSSPIYQEGGRRMLHLGVAYSRQNSQFDEVLYRSRPEIHLSPRFVNTGFFPAKSSDLLGLEAAFVHGPLSVQTEYMQNAVNSVETENPIFRSYYVQGSFFFTGENRRYKREFGVFNRVRPNSELFNGVGGGGAWEIASRYSWLNLDDGPVQGGKLKTVVVGLNWYLNPNTRVMWNYNHANRTDFGNGNFFQMRLAVDF
jgi:phosphate-selective porin OprO/OprP